MSQAVKPSYTITADNPETGAQVIRVLPSLKAAEDEVNRLNEAGMKNIRCVQTRNPGGNAG